MAVRAATTTVTAKRWILADACPEALVAFPDLHPVVAKLLWRRGIRTRANADAFLEPEYDAHRHDPFLFRDMARAVDRIIAARAAGERIVVHGDYDADGVSGAAVLADTLTALGCAVDVFIPHRETDGYGFTAPGVAAARAAGARLIITCDCGIASAAAIAQAREGGIDVIVTDHHQIPVGADGVPMPPPAYAILHPKIDGETYPYRELTGGGVALKLCEALAVRDAETERRLPDGFTKWLLDCAAISTVADFGPLTGENRVIVKYGLIVLGKTRRIGLQKLYDIAGIKPDRITPGTIGFQIAPRINAAGRIDHANEALKLLRTSDPQEAAALAEHLNVTNIERQRLVLEATAQAMAMVGDIGDRRAIVVLGDGWAPGIVGLIATKLKDVFHRPAIALTRHGGKVMGSGRSIDGYHIVRALDACRAHLAGYGGHPQACGLTLVSPDAVDAFTVAFEAHAADALRDADLTPTLAVDAELSLCDATLDLAHAMDTMEPFGVGNPTPRFLARGVRVTDVRLMGTTGAHCRITVRHGVISSAHEKSHPPQSIAAREISSRGLVEMAPIREGVYADSQMSNVKGQVSSLVCFRFKDICPTIARGDTIDVVYELGVNEWNGRVEPQMKVVDVRQSEA